MRNLSIPFTTLAFLLLLNACTKESLVAPVELESPKNLVAPFNLETEEEFEAFAKTLENNTAQSRHRVIHLRNGSHNQLQVIVDASKPFDHIIIDAGKHYEDKTVYIDHPLFIQGEEGATLYSGVKAIATPDAGLLQPALHILNTRKVMIWNVDFKPIGEAGGIGVLIEQSKHCLVAKSSFHDFQSGIATQHGDYAFIWQNEIHSTSKGFTGEIIDVYGIWLINGDKIRVIDNVVTNSIFGIWSCDLGGLASRNECYNNFIGMILCNVPPTYSLPSGGNVGSENPGTDWLYRDNYSHDNIEVGILIIDGATSNRVYRNRGGNNGTYDIDASGPSLRFGDPVPGSFSNRINSTDYPKTTIRDCGEGNTVIGGTLIKNAVCD